MIGMGGQKTLGGKSDSRPRPSTVAPFSRRPPKLLDSNRRILGLDSSHPKSVDSQARIPQSKVLQAKARNAVVIATKNNVD